MKRLLYLLCFLILGAQIATAQNKGAASQISAPKKPATLSAQVQRGRELFAHSTKGTACGSCHVLSDVGTAVGPDLTKLASAVGPRGLAMAIQMNMTAYVQEVKTATTTFPGLEKQRQGDEIEVWDLSQTPAVLRKFTTKEIVSMKVNPTLWKHPPAEAGYTSQELADVVGFIRWASTGTQKEIKPDEVETSQ